MRYGFSLCCAQAAAALAVGCGGIEPIESPYTGANESYDSYDSYDYTTYVDDDDGTSTGDTFWMGESSTGDSPLCGNDVIDPGELCDGSDLGDQTCTSVNENFVDGTLGCRPDCLWDVAACSDGNEPARPPITALQCDTVGLPIQGLADGPVLRRTIDMGLDPALMATAVRVSVDLVHPDIGDLAISVQNQATPAYASLHQFACAGTADLVVSFDDAAKQALDCSTSAQGASVRPARPIPLGVATGPWILQVADMDDSDAALLLQWCVEVDYILE